MNYSLSAIFLLLTSISTSAVAPSLSEIADRLDSISTYSARVEYIASLPSQADDITYSVSLYSHAPADDDPLHFPAYLIDWQFIRDNQEVASGFSSYFSGHHYRSRDGRLLEYHTEWDSIPFLAGGGVHRQAQFVELLPSSIASQLRTFQSDSSRYNISVTSPSRPGSPLIISGKETVNGLTAREISISLDPGDFHPLSLLYENNPGAISEQTVKAVYSPQSAGVPDTLTEEFLIARYPRLFELYRSSNFRVENLPGSLMPSFSAPTVWGGRYTFNRGDRLPAPTVLVLLDSDVSSLNSTISDVREALSSLPMAVNILWAFRNNDIDAIEQSVGEARPGEETLVSSRTLSRDCGVTVYPTLIFINREGRVVATQIGVNNRLPEIVIEKTTMAR